jgi:DNA-binding transcriptional MocR family regulator
MDAVRYYIDKAQNHWDEHLAQIEGALRSALNRYTGYTANHLMLVIEVNTPADLMFWTVRKDPPVDIESIRDLCVGFRARDPDGP